MKSFIILVLLATIIVGSECSNFAWPSYGGNNHNTRNVNDVARGSRLSSQNLHLLSLVGTFETESDLEYFSTVPYVADDVIIVPSKNGYVYCLERLTLWVRWSVYLPDITQNSEDFCRSTPTRTHDEHVLINHQRSGRMTKLHIKTGAVAWSVVVHEHPFAVLTGSPSVDGDYAYFGVSSREELVSAFIPDYVCCSFVGAFIKLRISDGAVIHYFPLIDPALEPGPGGYSGVAAWGSQPVIYKRGNAVIFGTGNLYNAPPSVQECVDETPEADCVDERAYFNGVLSLDLDTFELNWYTRMTPYDAWVVACLFGGPTCPEVAGPDADFGMNPSLVEQVPMSDGTKRDILMIGQKSGVVWNLNAFDGVINYGVPTGPGGTLGGSSWGGATDGRRYYVGNINNGNICHYFSSPQWGMTYGGSWVGVNIPDGSLIFTTPDPNTLYEGEESYNEIVFGAMANGAPLIVNDLLIGTSTSLTGSLVIMNRFTGQVLYKYDTGATIHGGVAVYDNCIYFGHGYDPIFNDYWTGGHKFFAFCVVDPIDGSF